MQQIHDDRIDTNMQANKSDSKLMFQGLTVVDRVNERDNLSTVQTDDDIF